MVLAAGRRRGVLHGRRSRLWLLGRLRGRRRGCSSRRRGVIAGVRVRVRRRLRGLRVSGFPGRRRDKLLTRLRQLA